MVDLVGKLVPNTDFREFFLVSFDWNVPILVVPKLTEQIKDLASLNLAIVHSSAAAYSEISKLTARY